MEMTYRFLLCRIEKQEQSLGSLMYIMVCTKLKKGLDVLSTTNKNPLHIESFLNLYQIHFFCKVYIRS